MLDQTFKKISISLLHGYLHTVMDLMGYFVELSGREFDVSISIWFHFSYIGLPVWSQTG